MSVLINEQPLIPSYHSKVTSIGALHAEKIAEAILLDVLRIAFPAPFLCNSKTELLHPTYKPCPGNLFLILIVHLNHLMLLL